MKTEYRTHTCGQLRPGDVKKDVVLSGWVHRRRDHGGLIFWDLRDRYGLTQVTFNPDTNKEAWNKADKVRPEFVVRVRGKVVARPKDMVNDKLETGAIEIEAEEIEVLAKAKTPPFEIDVERAVDEEVRLKYRYLDLRRERMRDNMLLRHEMVKFFREYLDKLNFIEVETPIMANPSPEGARDYLVPSRLYPGEFYALPQSPQQFKQLLMVGGLDRYYQVARAFRDEDARSDRQPEHTQLDIEMSFMTQEEILDLVEKMFIKLTQTIGKKTGKKMPGKTIPRITYAEVMDQYGSDKPDLRFTEMQLIDVTKETRGVEFSVFANATQVKGIVVPGKGDATRKEIDDLTELAKGWGAGGLAWIKVGKGKKLDSSIVKFFKDTELDALNKTLGGKDGDLYLFVADEPEVVANVLGNLRNHLAKKLDLIDKKLMAWAFITDFPLFTWDTENKKISPEHHMFTMPAVADIAKLDLDPVKDKDEIIKMKSQSYDLICNGWEVASGSIRIHDPEIQEKIMKIIGIDKKEAMSKFGHMLEAMTYGAPPHGGIAPGIDRLLTLFLDEPSIREVMAFPKNTGARDPMTGSPQAVDEEQLKELHIDIRKKKQK
ncbi:aspartate--tRNA ligase [Patescibacteria group bacterium]